MNGLSNKEVRQRIRHGLVNDDKSMPTKTIKEIIIKNTCTLFNFINIVLGIAIILVGSYKNLLFLGVVVCNTLISTIQEVRAKKIIDKLSIISSSKASVIREGIRKSIHINNIVKDDLIIYELGNQVVVDSIILKGECEVNESFITGESKNVFKKKGDMILSGSFIVSGSVYARVEHVGLDNYTAVISHDAKKMKKEVTSEIMRALNKIVKYVSIALIPIGLLLLLRQFSIDGNTTQNAVTSVVAAVVGMIPEGLILLVSTVLAVSVLKLSKFNVLVQDLYAIETLARIDTLCLDKTGTITEGDMEISDMVLVDDHTVNEVDEILSIISTNLNDNNPTFKAINDKYKNDSEVKAVKCIPFSSEKKYSGVTLKDATYLVGAPEFILKSNYKKHKSMIEELSLDNRVLAVIKIDNFNKGDYLKNEVLAFILIKDKIRKQAKNTIQYFINNDVDIKIISGDSMSTVLNIAKRVGIDVYGSVSLNEYDKSEIPNLVLDNNIFARVKPDEKKIIIESLRRNGKVVCMTGDGVNDVLALKEADCAVSFGKASDAAKTVSELVLLDDNFDSMPEVVKEGRKTINNIERSASLFLAKTIYASLLALLFLFINYTYPFIPIQMTLINALTIGIPAFILALEPNHERVKGVFLIKVVSKALPSALTTVINIIILVFFASLLNINSSATSTMAVIITAFTALLLIYNISKPLNMMRRYLMVLITLAFVLCLLTNIGQTIFSLKYLTPNNLLILLPLLYISYRLFNLFSNLVLKLIDKKKKWFI